MWDNAPLVPDYTDGYSSADAWRDTNWFDGVPHNSHDDVTFDVAYREYLERMFLDSSDIDD